MININFGDCEICRMEGIIHVYGSDGEVVLRLEGEWQDSQILQVVQHMDKYANKFLNIGFERGKSSKINEIKKALEL